MSLTRSALRRGGLLGRCVLLAALPVMVCGCGQPAAPGKVSGQVLLDGKPLPGGTITFRSTGPKSIPIQRTIDEHGNYPEVELPAGEVAVMVDNRALKPPPPRGPITLPKGLPPEMAAKFNAQRSGPPPAPTQAGKYIAIPDRYSDGDSPELNFTVQSGDQKHDIQLKSK